MSYAVRAAGKHRARDPTIHARKRLDATRCIRRIGKCGPGLRKEYSGVREGKEGGGGARSTPLDFYLLSLSKRVPIPSSFLRL